VHNNIYHLNR